MLYWHCLHMGNLLPQAPLYFILLLLHAFHAGEHPICRLGPVSNAIPLHTLATSWSHATDVRTGPLRHSFLTLLLTRYPFILVTCSPPLSPIYEAQSPLDPLGDLGFCTCPTWHRLLAQQPLSHRKECSDPAPRLFIGYYRSPSSSPSSL